MIRIGSFLLAVLLLPGVASADSEWRDWPLGERLKLSVGVFSPDIDTSGSLTQKAPLIVGTEVSFEDDLGLDDSESAVFAGLDWRFFKRHSLRFNYYALDRDAATTIDRQIVFDGITFPAGVTTETTFDISVFEVAYAYSLIFDETKDLYIGFGVSAQDMTFEILSRDLDPIILEAGDDFTAPLPTINLGFDYALSDAWTLELSAGYMDLDVSYNDDDYDARILVGNAGVNWQPLDNLGVGLYYSIFELDGEFEDEDNIGEFDLEYKGPRVGLDLLF